MLNNLLEIDDPMTKAVACYDIGEFSRLYPYSKLVLEKMGCKSKLMHMVENESESVRE